MMAYGFKRPLVVTDVGGLPELIQEGKTGTVVPPGNGEKLSTGIEKILRLTDTVDFEANILELTQELGHKNFEKIFGSIMNPSS